MKNLKHGDKLVVDANPILSALIGGKAKNVIEKRLFELHTTIKILKEVQEHLSWLSAKRKIPLWLTQSTLIALPVVAHDEVFYKDTSYDALQILEARDPDDVDTLALAMHLSCPIWTNDKDFEISNV